MCIQDVKIKLNVMPRLPGEGGVVESGGINFKSDSRRWGVIVAATSGITVQARLNGQWQTIETARNAFYDADAGVITDNLITTVVTLDTHGSVVQYPLRVTTQAGSLTLADGTVTELYMTEDLEHQLRPFSKV